MKKLTVLSLLILVLNCQKKQVHLKRIGEPDVVFFDTSDSDMNNAVDLAKNTFPEFEKAILSDNLDYSNFTLKQRFATEDGNGEHLWIREIEYENGRYFGIVDNVPVSLKQIQVEDTIEISKKDISDWMYYDKNIVKGAYTVKVLRKQMSAEERRIMSAEGLIYE